MFDSIVGMRSYLDKAYRAGTNVLPPRVAARVDLLRPSYRNSWGGPLNGQERRREIVRGLASVDSFDRVIETGTYRGTSTEFFSAVFGCPIDTVEANERSFAYSKARLAVLPSVVVTLGDSRAFLRDLARRHPTEAETTFIYLDAHWENDLPLREEIQIIRSAWPRVAVMIDDFEVPGDSDYQFSDEGAGKALTENYLPASELDGWALFYPAAPGCEETGARAGCAVLVAPALSEAVMPVASLRFSRKF